MSLLERIYSYRKYIGQNWEVPNYPLNFVALIKRLFPFYVHGCKYMQRSTDILHYGRKIRALFHQNTYSTIFIPSFLRIYVVEKGRRIEKLFFCCLSGSLSLSLSFSWCRCFSFPSLCVQWSHSHIMGRYTLRLFICYVCAFFWIIKVKELVFFFNHHLIFVKNLVHNWFCVFQWSII